MPKVPPAAEQTIAIDGSIRGVAGTTTLRFAAIADGATTRARGYRGTAVAWEVTLAGTAGPVAATDKLVLKKYDPVVRKHVEFKESKI